jgi:hypothetical protein
MRRDTEQEQAMSRRIDKGTCQVAATAVAVHQQTSETALGRRTTTGERAWLGPNGCTKSKETQKKNIHKGNGKRNPDNGPESGRDENLKMQPRLII